MITPTLLLTIFSMNCDSINSEFYNISRKLKEVDFCKCMDRNQFLEYIKLPKHLDDIKEDCLESSTNILDVEIKYNKLKKELK